MYLKLGCRVREQPNFKVPIRGIAVYVSLRDLKGDASGELKRR
jgi:hypothetical protein